VYRPYNSTLSRYPLLGGKPHPNFDQTSKKTQSSAHSDLPDLHSSSTTTTNNDQEEEVEEFKSIDLGSAGLTTFIAQKHKLDPIKKFCKVESLGGVCQDSNCKNLHERDFKPKEEEKAEYLLQQQQRQQL
ncbi:hypothetical protein JCM5350_000051, partial [Sporobolomyces pararoseus]